MSGTFGDRFKGLRKDLGLTQESLADEFNKKYIYSFTKSSISMYENNKQVPEVDVLRKWSEFFGVSIDYLLGKTELKKGDDIPQELRDVGVTYMEVLKKAQDFEITPDELEELVDTILKFKNKKK